MKRLWLYYSQQSIEGKLLDRANELIEVFLKNWNNHGKSLAGDIQIIQSHLVAVIVDESVMPASGCSIDQSVAFMKELGNLLNVDLLDRSNVPYELDGKIVSTHFKNISEYIQTGRIGADTLVVNMQLNDAQGLNEQLMIRAEDSWLKKYFKKQALNSV